MGGTPEEVGYDVSDGSTKNVDGGFVNDRSQWETEVVSDPKRVGLTDRAMGFMDSCHALSRPFSFSFPIMRCTPTSKQRKLLWKKCGR